MPDDRRPYFYILDADHNVVPVADIHEWARQFEHNEKRRVAWTEVNGVAVSTVFLGIDHNLGFSGRPSLFETMIFVPDQPIDSRFPELLEELKDAQWRYATWQEAEKGHETAVGMLRELF